MNETFSALDGPNLDVPYRRKPGDGDGKMPVEIETNVSAAGLQMHNIHAREEFRHKPMISAAPNGVIPGTGLSAISSL